MRLTNEQIKYLLGEAGPNDTHVDVLTSYDYYADYQPVDTIGELSKLSDLLEILELRQQIEQICQEEDEGVEE